MRAEPDAGDVEPSRATGSPIEADFCVQPQFLAFRIVNVGNTLGVMIVDPGERSDELEIGELRSGYIFWMVGNDRVHDLREMVNHLVSEATSPATPPRSNGNTSAWIEKNGTARVRVVYTFDSESGRGTNTQYMRLEPRDIAELVELRERLESINAE